MRNEKGARQVGKGRCTKLTLNPVMLTTVLGGRTQYVSEQRVVGVSGWRTGTVTGDSEVS
jgi:hypothetical protein